MKIVHWHYGKLLILWVWGLASMVYLWYVVDGLEVEPDDALAAVFGIAAQALMVLIPAALSVITWKWLGGKEPNPEQESDDRAR